MKRYWEYFGFVLMAAVVAAASATVTSRIIAQKPRPVIRPVVVLPISAAEILNSQRDFRGRSESPFTFVEFMDYQCPPCRRVEKKIPDILRQYDGRLRLTIRNCPLEMHSLAIPAAVAAEAAREQGKFWSMHDALMMHDSLQLQDLAAIARTSKLDLKRFARLRDSLAKQAVAADMAQAKSLNISATPTFLLCSERGQVIRLGTLDQLKDYSK